MAHPEVDIVAELVGGTTVAAEIVNAAIANRKSVVTANKELMAACGPEIWDRAIHAGINVAMEASVAGGIPIHAVLREGISGDRITALYGILNGTCNYILTEMEKRGAPLETVLAEAQQLGYAEADPSADIDGIDARSKLAILAALAFGEKITPSDIFMEGIRRISPLDFRYAHQLGHTIRLICAARQTPEGLILSVRPALIPADHHSGGRAGRLQRGLGEGRLRRGHVLLRARRGSLPTGVAVVSDLMRVAREIRSGSPERVSPFAHERLGEYTARVGGLANARLLSALPGQRPAGHPGRAVGHPGGETHQPGSRPAVAAPEPSAICRSSSPSNPPTNTRFARPSRRWPSSTSCWNRRWPCPWRPPYER